MLQGKEVNQEEVSLKSLHTHNSDVEVQVENLEISKGDEILEVEET